jgi:hypothetical protein
MTHHDEKPGKTGSPEAGHKRNTWSENIDLMGDELVASVKRLASDSKVRKIRITEPDGDLLVEMPLTLGAIAGGAVVLAAPLLAVLAAIAAFLTKVKLEVIRDGNAPDNYEV